MSIPLILITGWLGSGKTTFLNRLLAFPSVSSRKLALIINEFGSLGVDGQLVSRGDYTRFDLNRGSVFCVCIKTDFVRTLTTIAEETRPDLVLVEATGVADPCDLEQFLDVPGLAGRFHVQTSICLVDALNFTRVAPHLRAAREQVFHADQLVINKTDLVSGDEAKRLAAALAAINPAAPVTQAVRGAIPEELLGGAGHTRKAGDVARCAPEGICAVSVRLAATVEKAGLLDAIRSLGGHLLRFKGIVDFGEGPLLIESVYDRFSEQPVSAEAERGMLTVIASGVPKDDVRRLLAPWQAPEPVAPA